MSIFCPPPSPPRILVVQHSPLAPGNVFCRSLVDQGAELTVVKPLAGGVLPPTTTGLHGLVVLGGPQHANDDDAGPHFPQLMTLMRKFEASNKPVAAICLGCQLLARAYGATPKRMASLEFGFIQHRLTAAGAADPLLQGIEPPPLMEYHEDTFDLPIGAILLIEGQTCRQQCFRVGTGSYGFQFHLEVDAEQATSWLKKFRSGESTAYESYLKNFSDDFFDELATDIKEYSRASEMFCNTVASRWLALASRRINPIVRH